MANHADPIHFDDEELREMGAILARRGQRKTRPVKSAGTAADNGPSSTGAGRASPTANEPILTLSDLLVEQAFDRHERRQRPTQPAMTSLSAASSPAVVVSPPPCGTAATIALEATDRTPPPRAGTVARPSPASPPPIPTQAATPKETGGSFVPMAVAAGDDEPTRPHVGDAAASSRRGKLQAPEARLEGEAILASSPAFDVNSPPVAVAELAAGEIRRGQPARIEVPLLRGDEPDDVAFCEIEDISASPPPLPSLTPPGVSAVRTRQKASERPWFETVFTGDFLRTLPGMTKEQRGREAEFIIDALGLSPGAGILDVGCGHGRQAIDLAVRGFHVTALDLSHDLLARARESATRANVRLNLVQGDMRSLSYYEQFAGVYCIHTTFGYFDDETNRQVLTRMARGLLPKGRLLLGVVNRDCLIRDLPLRTCWQADGCMVLEEVSLNYSVSRLLVKRTMAFEDGRHVEQEFSVRAYALHELVKLVQGASLRLREVSGDVVGRGRFFGREARQILLVAEKI